MEGGAETADTNWNQTTQGPSLPGLVPLICVQRFQRRRFRMDLLSKYEICIIGTISAERKMFTEKLEYMLN